MADYDLSKAFERIERELIDSMMRNLDAHRAEETARGYNWEQWQALQLKALEKYRTTNRKKFTQPFNALNNEIAQMLRDSYNDGATEQEKKILQQVKKGYKGAGTNAGAQTGTAEVGGEFFKTNNRKLDALVQATTHDMNRAEHAVLRRANDQYRKIIFSAQVYANTGAGTYEKAVDMATRDFLRAGINGIQYRNGSQHSITEYARMAIKTASTRAYLQGEGDMRKEMGIPTVILNKRTNACPLCAPFVGKVFIDDVWSGGSSTGISPVTGAKYPLLSDAIAAGLYHPNCRDIHTTYFEGINTAPEGSTYTKEELQAMADTYKAEQEESYCERQAERCERLEEYSLDKENKAQYAARAVNWRKRSAKCSSKLKACKKRLAELSESTDESGISEAPAVENSTVKSVEAVKNNPVETVEKSSGSGIIKEQSKKEISVITDKAINRVPCVSIAGYTEQQNKYIQQQHKELLNFARSKNSSNEVAFVFSSDFSTRKEFLGSDDRISYSSSGLGMNIVVLHNHPRNSSYSLNDVIEFVSNSSIKTLTIVKNNGVVETLTKLQTVDKEKLLLELNRLVKKKVKNGLDSEYDKVVREFLTKKSEGGIFEWLK